MRKGTVVVLLIAVAAVLALAFAMRGEGGEVLRQWMSSIHGGH